MATRKQRRRREKDIRHEYETVFLDDEGHEIEPPPKEERAEREKTKAAPARGRGRQPRAVQPPSWQRVAKRAAIFGPLMLVLVFVLPAKNGRTSTITTALIFIAIFIPFSYLMDSMMWRSYQKRLNKPLKDDDKSRGKPGGKGR